MSDLLLMRWLIKSVERICTKHWAVGAVCAVSLVGYIVWDAYQSARQQDHFDKESILQRIEKLEKTEQHILDLLEAQKLRRNLTLPAEPDEGY